MIALKFITLWIVLAFSKVTECFGFRNVMWMLTIATLILFGDILIPKGFYILHLCWEVVESVLEHFLLASFDLTDKQAEFVTAWIGIMSLTALIVMLLYKAYLFALTIPECICCQKERIRQRMAEQPGKTSFILSAVSLGTVGTMFLLMS